MELITPHITYREATHSDTAARHGIDNTPGAVELSRMRVLALRVFEPLRKGLGNRPIYLSSFFRCTKLNKAVKGSKKSQHIRGEAMDIDNDNNPDGPTNLEIFNYIRDNLEFDQLIREEGNDQSPAWVHVSFSAGNNRHQVLRSKNGKYYSL
jgi:zinc D-Ala-D-Ala carboxypeptidase